MQKSSSPSTYHSWADTQLLAELSRRDDEAAVRCVAAARAALPTIESVLRSGGTGPLDFTLHDDQHAFRVAEWIAELLGDQIETVSAYDVALSLFAAYIHDIGMTPKRQRVDAVFQRLFIGTAADLQTDDDQALQEWLDDFHSGLEPPVSPNAAELDRLRQARLLTAHFARYRHNAWSEAWVREHDELLKPLLYAGWVDDLVALSSSHHEGYETLHSDRFDPALVGPPSGMLHLRHCACLLRMADILDFDPERTPQVIFEHRDIDDRSEIFWRKDHQIVVELDGPAVQVVARPTDAFVHRAVLETIDGIDTELELCRRLADESPFDVAPRRAARLPNAWEFEPRARSDVRSDGSYEYIDGTFRPDIARILELLGGTALYGTPWAALRELLQNALDAVREVIAHERLRRQDPLDPALVEILSAEQYVEFSLEPDAAGLWLVCRDSGVGMTKERLVNQFLLSGKAKGRVDLELERACRKRGFSVGRTARLTSRARRSQTPFASAIPWHAESLGSTR